MKTTSPKKNEDDFNQKLKTISPKKEKAKGKAEEKAEAMRPSIKLLM